MTDPTADSAIPVDAPSTGAVSVYGAAAGGAEEFPILKAFQQYIDAEQSKARKRMVGLCMFFGCLMTIVIAVFLFMLHETNQGKQLANDQLIKLLMADRDRKPVVVQPPAATVVAAPAQNPAGDAALKAVADTLSALQRQIAEDRARPAAPAAPAGPTAADLERERRVREDTAKLRKAKELIEREKRQLAAEKEKLRQAEIDRQRRRLYPEFYARQDKGEKGGETPSGAAKTGGQTPARQGEAGGQVPKSRRVGITQADIDEILAEADAAREQAAREVAEAHAKKKSRPKAKPAPKPAPEEDDDAAATAPSQEPTDADSPKKKAKPAKSAVDEDDSEAIEYFKDDELTVPVKVGGKSASWSIGL